MEKSNSQDLGKGEVFLNDDYGNTPQIIYDLNSSDFYPEKLLSKKFKNLFVTIPHTDIDHITLHNDVKDKFKTEYVITCTELHQDGDTHIHQLIIFTSQYRLSQYHKMIANYDKRVKGTINYQSAKNIPAVINYIKKNEQFVTHGNEEKQMTKTGKSGGQKDNTNTKKSYNEVKDDIYSKLIEMVDGNEITKEEAIEYVKHYDPREFVKNYDKIMKYIETHFTPKNKEWDIPEPKMEHIKLNEWQTELYELLNTPPKPRQIIWVRGEYGVGKSFMLNYIETNYEYGIYNAGQSVSYDNVVYGYKQEGVIAWDIPRNFDWNTLNTPFCNLIEKFSDVGQTLSSKKYTGNKVRVKGHTLVFSNHNPPEELQHRDIKLILALKPITFKIINNKYVVESKLPNNTTKFYYYDTEQEMHGTHRKNLELEDMLLDEEND